MANNTALAIIPMITITMSNSTIVNASRFPRRIVATNGRPARAVTSTLGKSHELNEADHGWSASRALPSLKLVKLS